MSRLPTMGDLEAEGASAGALLDAWVQELERAIAMAANESAREGFERDLKRVNDLWDEWAGGAA